MTSCEATVSLYGKAIQHPTQVYRLTLGAKGNIALAKSANNSEEDLPSVFAVTARYCSTSWSDWWKMVVRATSVAQDFREEDNPAAGRFLKVKVQPGCWPATSSLGTR